MRRRFPNDGNRLNSLLSLIILMSILLLILSSCRSSRMPSASQLPVLRDSVRVEIRERLVHIHDTLRFAIPQQHIERSSRDSASHLETALALSDAIILPDGSLYHTLRHRPGCLKTPVDTLFKVRDSIVYRDRKVPVCVEVEKKLNLWQKLKIEIGGVFIILFLIWAAVTFYHFWKKLG